MNQPIGLTPHELVMMFVGMCAAFATIAGAITIIVNLINKAKQPEAKQNEKIAEHDQHLKDIDSRLTEFENYFDRDRRRFQQIEMSNEITQEALLALLQHGISGNSIDKLTVARDKLQEYLISKNVDVY